MISTEPTWDPYPGRPSTTGTDGVYYRRYSCVSCAKCKAFDFLNCLRKDVCGEWMFEKFLRKTYNACPA